MWNHCNTAKNLVILAHFRKLGWNRYLEVLSIKMIVEDHTEEKEDHSREEQREKQLIKDQTPGGGRNGKNDFAMICTRF